MRNKRLFTKSRGLLNFMKWSKKTCPCTTGWSISSRHIKTHSCLGYSSTPRAYGLFAASRWRLSRDFTHFDQTFETFTLQPWTPRTAPVSLFSSKRLFDLQEQHWHFLEVKVLIHWRSETGSRNQGTRDDERCLNARVIFKFLKTSSFLLAKISHLASRSADAHGWALCGICAACIPRLGNSPTNQADRIQPAGEATKQTT